MPRPLTSLRRFVASLRPLAAVSLLAWVSQQGWPARMCPSIPSWTLPEVSTKDIILTHTYSVQTAVARRLLYIPKIFRILHKKMLAPPWEEFAPKLSYVWDILINIVGFIPFGFFFCAYLT